MVEIAGARGALIEVQDTGTAHVLIVESTIEILQGIGKQPIRLKRDVPGFLVNRMQAALMREALALVDQGVRWHQASMARERKRFNEAMQRASELVRESSDDAEPEWR